MARKLHLFIVLFLCYSALLSQEYLYVEHFEAESTTSYTDNFPYKHYDFAIPVNANVLTVPGDRVNTGSKGDYFYSVYGPRPLSKYDFHLGEDITARVRDGSTSHDDTNPPPIISMCDGTIIYIDNTFGDKGSIEVRCDDIYFDPDDNDGWGEVYLAYRHMGTHSSGLVVGSSVSKGGVLGDMGETGASSHHLHLSLMRCTDDCETSDPDFENVNPLRLFNPDSIPHLLSAFTREGVFMQLLETTSTTATFRAIFLPEQVAIHSFKVNYNGSNHASFVFEEINLTGDRDNPCAEPNICVFPNAFNRYKSAFERYEDRKDDYYYDHDDNGTTPDVGFPSLTYPIGNDYPFNAPVYVLDVVVSNLPSGFDPSLLVLEVRDIYGSGVRAIATDTYITSTQSGNWNDPTTWGGMIPGSGSKVLINHDLVVSQNTSVKTIFLSSTITANASLQITNGALLTVDENILVVGDNDNQSTELIIDNDGSLSVGESLIIKRYYDADLVQVTMDDNSNLDVTGDLIFISDDYTRFSGGGVDSFAFLIGTNNGNPQITVGGDMVITYGPEANKDLLSKIGVETSIVAEYNQPALNVAGDLKLNSNVAESGSNDIGFELFSNASIEVGGDILFDYSASYLEGGQDIVMKLKNSSEVTTNGLTLSSILDTSTDNNLIQINDEGRLIIRGELDASKDNSLQENMIDVNQDGILEIQGSVVSSEESQFLFENSSKAIFSGNSTQEIPGLGSNSYGILEINKSSGDISLQDNITVSNMLVLKEGIVDAGSFTVSLTQEATLDVQNAESYIDGTLSKEFGASPNAFTFQVGDNGRAAPVKADLPAASSTVSVKYHRASLTSNYTSPIEEVASGYWEVDASAATDMSFGWTDACDLNIESVSESPQTLFMVQENSNSWEQITGTSIASGSESCDESDSDDESGSLVMNVPAGSNKLSFGSTDISANPLPVELISFEIEKDDSEVILRWETASEINSDFFEVQKSKSGIDFHAVGQLKAAGNSSDVKTYTLRDKNPYSGISYYRLKQVDVDGSFVYFETRMLDFNLDDLLSFYPSVIPVGGSFNVSFDGEFCDPPAIDIIGIDGSRVEEFHPDSENASYNNYEVRTKIGKTGIYLVRISCGDWIFTRKIVVR